MNGGRRGLHNKIHHFKVYNYKPSFVSQNLYITKFIITDFTVYVTKFIHYRVYTVGAKSMARLRQNYVHWLNYIFAPRCVREVWFFLFYRFWIGEQF
jgi:hypothetical protein